MQFVSFEYIEAMKIYYKRYSQTLNPLFIIYLCYIPPIVLTAFACFFTDKTSLSLLLNYSYRKHWIDVKICSFTLALVVKQKTAMAE